MYKLKNQYINRMIEEKLTSKEIDFLLYIALFQDDAGKIYSVYYKDICEKLDVSIQKFYDIIKSLQAHKLIEVEKREATDISVTLVGNDFSDKDFSEGYLKVSQHDFQSTTFRNLKAGSKLIYLYMQRYTTAGRHGFVETIYSELCELLEVAKKSIQNYLHELKEAKLLFIALKRNKAYNYEICIKNSSVIIKKQPTNEEDLKKQNYKDHITRNFKRYLPEKASQCLEDITNLANPAFGRVKERQHFFECVMNAIHECIQMKKMENPRKQPRLNAAQVNKCLTKSLRALST